jgi:hypothetical protein
VPESFFANVRLVRVIPSLALYQDGHWRGLRPQYNSAQRFQASPGGLLRPDFEVGLDARTAEVAARSIRYVPRGGPGTGQPPRVGHPSDPFVARPRAEFEDDLAILVMIYLRDVSHDLTFGPPSRLAVVAITDLVFYSRLTARPPRWLTEPRVTVDTVPRAAAEEHVLRHLDTIVVRALDHTFRDE